jgi:superfamily II DNA/RNA helicase
MKINSIQYYASLPSDKRSLSLYRFINEDINVLVSTDLGSRGLDFPKPINTVIEFDMS